MKNYLGAIEAKIKPHLEELLADAICCAVGVGFLRKVGLGHYGQQSAPLVLGKFGAAAMIAVLSIFSKRLSLKQKIHNLGTTLVAILIA